MAVYIPAGKRRRRVAVLVVAAVIVGVVVGLIVGRATAPDLSEGVSHARGRAGEVIDVLDSLPSEYEALHNHQPGKSTASILHGVDDAETRLRAAIDKAEWLGPSGKQRLHASLDKVRADVTGHAPPSTLQADVRAATRVIDDEFGIAPAAVA